MDFNVGLRKEGPLAADLRMASRKHNWCVLGRDPVLGDAEGKKKYDFLVPGSNRVRFAQFDPHMDWRRHTRHPFDWHTKAILIFLK